MEPTITLGPDGDSDHLYDHRQIADHLNGHRTCPTCRAVVNDQDAEAHRRTHVGRAIAAR